MKEQAAQAQGGNSFAGNLQAGWINIYLEWLGIAYPACVPKRDEEIGSWIK